MLNSNQTYTTEKFDESLLDFSHVGVLLIQEKNLKVYEIRNGFQEHWYCENWFQYDLPKDEYSFNFKCIQNQQFNYVYIGNYVVIYAISKDIMGIGYFLKTDCQAESYLINRIKDCLDRFKNEY